MSNKKPLKTLEEIEAEFRASIVVPESIPAQQFFFCPVGYIGAGKTTITKPIAEKFGLVRLSSDELREILKKNEYNYESLKMIGFNVARDFALKGYSIAFDMGCGDPEVKTYIENFARKMNAKIVWVHVECPEEHIFKKFREHAPSWLADNPQVMIDNYYYLKQKREEEGTHFDFLFTFDTSRPDLSEQINTCALKIGDYIK